MVRVGKWTLSSGSILTAKTGGGGWDVVGATKSVTIVALLGAAGVELLHNTNEGVCGPSAEVRRD